MGSSSASCAPYSNVAWNAKLPTPTRPNHWRNKSNARGQGTVPSNSLQSRPEDGFVSVLFVYQDNTPRCQATHEKSGDAASGEIL